MRSTRVLTKKPDQIVERAVGAARDRAADRDVVCRHPAASAGPQAPACSTMNRLAPLSRASASRPPCSSAGRVKRHAVAAMARHRGARPVARQLDLVGKVLRARRSRTPAGAQSRSRCPPPPPAPRAATACSRHIAPAGPASARRLAGQARPIGAAEIARQRRQRPAVAGNVMQQQQQHVLARRPAQTDAPAAAARWQGRSRVARRRRAPRAGWLRVTAVTPAAAAPPTGSPGGARRACRGRWCAGSRGALPGRRARLPAPRGRARR